MGLINVAIILIVEVYSILSLVIARKSYQRRER
jgi:hypothetical protein